MIGRFAAFIIAVTTVAGIVLVADVGGPLRAVVMLAFFLVVPGLAAVGFFEPLRPDTRLVLVLAVSIVTTIVVSQILLYAGNWTPELGYSVVALVSLAAISAQVVEVLARRLSGGAGQRTGDDRRRRPDDASHHRPENRQAGVASGSGSSGAGSGQSSSQAATIAASSSSVAAGVTSIGSKDTVPPRGG